MKTDVSRIKTRGKIGTMYNTQTIFVVVLQYYYDLLEKTLLKCLKYWIMNTSELFSNTLAQFSLHVHKGGLKPHFIFISQMRRYGCHCEAKLVPMHR